MAGPSGSGPLRPWRSRRLLDILVVCAAAAVLAGAAKPPDSKQGAARPGAPRNFRLPGDVIPSNYTLRLVTHFQDDNFRFYGQAIVDIDVIQETSVLRLNAKQLQVDQRAVTVTLLDEDDDSNSIPELQQVEEEAQGQNKPNAPPEEQKEEMKPEEKPVDQKPVEQKPEVQGETEKRPEDQKPDAQKLVDKKTELQKSEEQKPMEGKPVEQKVEDQKAENLPGEEEKPKDEKPDEQKLVEKMPEEQNTSDEQVLEDQKQIDEMKPVRELEKIKEEIKPEIQPEMTQALQPETQTDAQKQDMNPVEQEQHSEEPNLTTTQSTQDLEQEVQMTEKAQDENQDPVHKQDEKAEEQREGAVGDGEKRQPQEDTTLDPPAEKTSSRRRRQGHYQHRPRDAELQGLRLSNVSMDAALQQLVITVSEPLRAGSRYRVSIRYWGTLNTEDRGYYRGAYLVDGRARYVASTVFEPAEARRAFPCFDEPHMKANFSLILGRHKNYTTSANMPLDRTESMEEKPNWYWDYYPSTPKMPTYLVAFMVHDLEGTSLYPGDRGVQFRAWTVPGRSQQANFSLSVAPKIMFTLGAQLGAPGVLPKHDMVAVPGFRSEALENWGLISFEEHHLLLPANANQLNKQSVSTVVAHELAHVWFGNMLTPAWWSDIWLSEGFATFYSAEALQEIFPAWRFHETAAGNAYLLVTHTDALPNTTPVIHAADNPNKLEAVFGAISYYKGYWLLRMLEGALGADVFDSGVRRYVQRHQFSSVRTRDLWAALQEAVDEREALDLETAASASAATGDAIVVGDDSEEEDIARVVVPDTSVAPAPPPAATVAPAVSVRARRDAGLPMKATITQLVTGAVDLSDKESSEELPVSPESAERVTKPAASEKTAAKSPPVPAAVKRVQASDAVLSPPRRGPGATGFTGKLGWLPRPVAEIMNNWVTQPGHPIVSVSRNLETGDVTLNQRRYMAPTPPGGFPCNASTAWWIPVRWATLPRGSGATGPAELSKSVFWMPPTCANVTLPVKVPREELVILNAGLGGLYRVRYDSAQLQQLARLSRAAWRQLAPLSRLQLVADALDLARAGRAPYQHALRMVDHLGRDNNPMVWRAALPHLTQLQRQLRTRRDGVALRSWLQDLVSPHASMIGFTTRAQDTPLQASLRYKVTTLACLADHSSCQRKAKKSLKQFMAGDTDAIPVGRLTNAQLCAAVRWGSPAEWRFVRAQLSAPTSVLPRKASASALGCSRDQETLRSLLADTVDANSTLRRSDVSAILGAVAANELGTDIVLRFLDEKAPQVYKRLGGHPRVEKAFREIAESLNTKKQLERLDAVLRQFQSQTTSRSPPAWGRDVVRENIRWAERSRGEVSRWLRARADSDDDLELRRTQSKTKTKARPAGTGPAVVEPAVVGPARAGPAGAGPAVVGPTVVGPARAVPAGAVPAGAGPAGAGPAGAGPAGAGPAVDRLAGVGPAGAAPAPTTASHANTKAPRQLGEPAEDEDTDGTSSHGIFNHLLNTIFLNSQI